MPVQDLFLAGKFDPFLGILCLWLSQPLCLGCFTLSGHLSSFLAISSRLSVFGPCVATWAFVLVVWTCLWTRTAQKWYRSGVPTRRVYAVPSMYFHCLEFVGACRCSCCLLLAACCSLLAEIGGSPTKGANQFVPAWQPSPMHVSVPLRTHTRPQGCEKVKKTASEGVRLTEVDPFIAVLLGLAPVMPQGGCQCEV